MARRPALAPLQEHEQLALVDMVNRVLDRGVVVTGEVTISRGGVDLLFLGLQIILASAETLERVEGVRGLRSGRGGESR